mmetsp:Transcript_40150/g.92277  ORF Transcript_40150/g.92277 Transcript_40150/m.92277 type:complete len:213 (+) Transcript_40150:42-680(+)
MPNLFLTLASFRFFLSSFEAAPSPSYLCAFWPVLAIRWPALSFRLLFNSSLSFFESIFCFPPISSASRLFSSTSSGVNLFFPDMPASASSRSRAIRANSSSSNPSSSSSSSSLPSSSCSSCGGAGATKANLRMLTSFSSHPSYACRHSASRVRSSTNFASTESKVFLMPQGAFSFPLYLAQVLVTDATIFSRSCSGISSAGTSTSVSKGSKH